MDAWVVVGLGNPGPTYADTRHNVGQMTLDELARRAGTAFRSHKGQAQVADVRLGTGPGGAPGPKTVLAKPTSYMNVSGGPVAAVLRMNGAMPDRLVVVHDDLDIPFGQVRLKTGGGEGGHNGLRSITSVLGTRDYIRVRVGIDRPPGRMDPADYVLQNFSRDEMNTVSEILDRAADAALCFVTDGLDKTMNRFNGEVREP